MKIFRKRFNLIFFIGIISNGIAIFFLSSYYNSVFNRLVIEKENLSLTLKNIESNYLFVFEETQKLKSIIDFHNDNKSNDPDLIIQDDSIKSIYKNLTKDNPENYSLYSSSQNTIDTLIFRDNNNCLIKIIISFPRIDIVYLIDRYFPEYSLLVNNFRTPYYRSIICDKTGKVEYTSGIYSWKYSHSNPDDMTGFNWRFYADSDNKSDLEFAFVGNSRNENDFFGRIRWVYNPSNLGSVLALPPDSIEPFQTTLIKFYKK